MPRVYDLATYTQFNSYQARTQRRRDDLGELSGERPVLQGRLPHRRRDRKQERHSCSLPHRRNGCETMAEQTVGNSVHEYSPRLLALYGYTPASCNQSGIPRWEADACSWSWTALVEPTVSSWTVLKSRGINQLSGRACRPDKRSEPVRGEDVSWRMASRCAGPGFFIMGDAAGLLDPGSQKGVLRALISGIKASYFILEILNGREREAAAYQAYSDWFQRLFMLEAAELSDRYRLLFPEIR